MGMTFLYNLAFAAFGIFYFPVFLIKIKQAEDPGRLWRERLGEFSSALKSRLQGKKLVWLHAVSVGEVRAVEKFITEWLAQTDQTELFLTTVTPTGQKMAKKLEGPRVHVAYLPFDLTFAVRRFFRVVKPQAILLAETEIWPNLLTEAKSIGIPVGVINARLSEKSFKRYQTFSFLLKRLWKKIDFVLTQTEEDAARFRKLGVPSEAVREMGNMKFDLTEEQISDAKSAEEQRKIIGIYPEDTVFIGGSTHPGEEALLTAVFLGLKVRFPSLRLILVPRHIERSEKILKGLAGSGYRIALSSARPAQGTYDILIVNELGILKDLYKIADLVFMGGSFIPHGGQNPIEPARFEKAVMHGPHVFNFNKIYRELDQGGGAFEVKDPKDLKAFSEKFLSDPALCREAGIKAYQIVNRFRGASKRQVGWTLTFLASRQTVERTNTDGEPQKLFSAVGGGQMS